MCPWIWISTAVPSTSVSWMKNVDWQSDAVEGRSHRLKRRFISGPRIIPMCWDVGQILGFWDCLTGRPVWWSRQDHPQVAKVTLNVRTWTWIRSLVSSITCWMFECPCSLIFCLLALFLTSRKEGKAYYEITRIRSYFLYPIASSCFLRAARCENDDFQAFLAL